jgi:hypothetical protein
LSASQPHQVPTGPWFYLGEQRKIIKRRKENAAFWWKLPIECVRSQCVRMNPSQWVYGDVQNAKTQWQGFIHSMDGKLIVRVNPNPCKPRERYRLARI